MDYISHNAHIRVFARARARAPHHPTPGRRRRAEGAEGGGARAALPWKPERPVRKQGPCSPDVGRRGGGARAELRANQSCALRLLDNGPRVILPPRPTRTQRGSSWPRGRGGGPPGGAPSGGWPGRRALPCEPGARVLDSVCLPAFESGRGLSARSRLASGDRAAVSPSQTRERDAQTGTRPRPAREPHGPRAQSSPGATPRVLGKSEADTPLAPTSASGAGAQTG